MDVIIKRVEIHAIDMRLMRVNVQTTNWIKENG